MSTDLQHETERNGQVGQERTISPGRAERLLLSMQRVVGRKWHPVVIYHLLHDGPQEFTTMGPDARAYGRYAAVTIDDDRITLYDIDEEEAWIQSDAGVPLSEVA